MNSFGTLFHDRFFPWHFPDKFQISWHFQVFQTSGHPARHISSFCMHCGWYRTHCTTRVVHLTNCHITIGKASLLTQTYQLTSIFELFAMPWLRVNEEFRQKILDFFCTKLTQTIFQQKLQQHKHKPHSDQQNNTKHNCTELIFHSPASIQVFLYMWPIMKLLNCWMVT